MRLLNSVEEEYLLDNTSVSSRVKQELFKRLVYAGSLQRVSSIYEFVVALTSTDVVHVTK